MSVGSQIAHRLDQILRPLVNSMGFDLVRVKLMGGRRKTLQIMAERPNGHMNVDDCAQLSHAISALLDVEDPIEGEYDLEVSSPGIDRPLVRSADFERYAGHLAKIKLAVLHQGRKRFVGTVEGLEQDKVILQLQDAAPGEAEVRLPLDQIEEAKLVLTDKLIEDSLSAGKAYTV